MMRYLHEYPNHCDDPYFMREFKEQVSEMLEEAQQRSMIDKRSTQILEEIYHFVSSQDHDDDWAHH